MKLGLLITASSALLAGILATANQSPTDLKTGSEEKNFTYSGEIANLLNQKCVTCHRPGETGPMSFVGYENAKKYSKMIAFTTGKGKMPPWKTIPVDLEFADDNHLSKEEIEMLASWSENGAPIGDKNAIPPTPEFAEGWKLGQPDALWKVPYEHTLSAEGKDEYWNFVISPDIKEPVWISGIDVKPGNRKIVHHVIAFLDDKGRGKNLVQSKDGDKKSAYLSQGGGVGFTPDGSVGGWAPGTNPSRLPDNAGFLLKPGTDIILQIHYNKSGKVEKDQTEIGVYYNKGKVTEPVELAWMANPLIRIKAGDDKAKFTQSLTLPADIRIYSIMPHMHLLGREMRASATLPNGNTIRLIDVPDWDFNWQLVYGLKEPMVLPKGTKIKIEAVYDNSSNNPHNPSDPPKAVRWGEETTDEMMLLVVAYSVENKQETFDMMRVIGEGLLRQTLLGGK